MRYILNAAHPLSDAVRVARRKSCRLHQLPCVREPDSRARHEPQRLGDTASATQREGEWAVALINRDTEKRFSIPARTSGHYAMKDIRLSESDSAWFYSQTC
ncbi:hypothetical protein GGP80_002094 [Salinibacter ruber]|jgi:hypothetical protein|nr:hypothetical protein [Salinibacter ruber]MCS3936105.1 hypothetical protein [Salinibacter ruber]MCS4043408.1 hypothetical protein [Salinibacter ruber]